MNHQLILSLPTEIMLILSNYLPFKTYIQLSKTCKSLHHVLISINAIRYLNYRFNFGKETGSLLLFVYYNILYIPNQLRKVVLGYFIHSFKNNLPCYLVKGWSLIRAIHCLDPGRHFMLLLLKDNNDDHFKLMEEAQKNLLIQHQRDYSIDIIDSIIESQSYYKDNIRKSKTYQTVFQKLIQSGDLRTVENCLRSLGSPIDSISLSDSNYCNRFPITTTYSHDEIVMETDIEVICKHSLYLGYNSNEMHSLTRRLLEKYHVKVNTRYKPLYHNFS